MVQVELVLCWFTLSYFIWVTVLVMLTEASSNGFDHILRSYIVQYTTLTTWYSGFLKTIISYYLLIRIRTKPSL